MKKLFCLLALTAIANQAFAQDMVKTGEGIRQKSAAFLSLDIYKISHSIATVPAAEDVAAALAASTNDKKFELEFLRDVKADDLKGSLDGAYKNCDYKNKDKVKELLSIFTTDFKKGDVITIAYSAGKTSFTSGASVLSVDGDEIMQATWCIWLGKGIKDQKKLKDELVKNAKK
jgi:hypothetical protein